MPKARPPLEPLPPAPLADWEAAFIKETVLRFFGADAVVRSFGPDPKRLQLHVETGRSAGMTGYECAGVLSCKIDRDGIDLVVTKRGERVWGDAKIAYRQGVVL
jgi:hypothetical protein